MMFIRKPTRGFSTWMPCQSPINNLVAYLQSLMVAWALHLRIKGRQSALYALDGDLALENLLSS